MRYSLGVATIIFSLLSNTMTSWAQDFCQEGWTRIADFTPGTLSIPDGTSITDEFADQGMLFSADDSDLPPEYQKSTGPYENMVYESELINVFRINFLNATMTNVSVTLGDIEVNAQVHTLTAFDISGNVIDTDSLTEDGQYPDRFTLTVSSCAGIAAVVLIEDPAGVEGVERVTYTQRR